MPRMTPGPERVSIDGRYYDLTPAATSALKRALKKDTERRTRSLYRMYYSLIRVHCGDAGFCCPNTADTQCWNAWRAAARSAEMREDVDETAVMRYRIAHPVGRWSGDPRGW